jgi:hypothetical protein
LRWRAPQDGDLEGGVSSAHAERRERPVRTVDHFLRGSADDGRVFEISCRFQRFDQAYVLLLVGSRPVGAPSVEDVADRLVNRRCVEVLARKNGWIPFKRERYDRVFPLAECEVERLEERRSGGKAAVGAIAGALLAGPLGLIAGAAIGGRKHHVIILKHGSATLILQVSSSELQTFVARGHLKTEST